MAIRLTPISSPVVPPPGAAGTARVLSRELGQRMSEFAKKRPWVSALGGAGLGALGMYGAMNLLTPRQPRQHQLDQAVAEATQTAVNRMDPRPVYLLLTQFANELTDQQRAELERALDYIEDWYAPQVPVVSPPGYETMQ